MAEAGMKQGAAATGQTFEAFRDQALGAVPIDRIIQPARAVMMSPVPPERSVVKIPAHKMMQAEPANNAKPTGKQKHEGKNKPLLVENTKIYGPRRVGGEKELDTGDQHLPRKAVSCSGPTGQNTVLIVITGPMLSDFAWGDIFGCPNELATPCNPSPKQRMRNQPLLPSICSTRAKTKKKSQSIYPSHRKPLQPKFSRHSRNSKSHRKPNSLLHPLPLQKNHLESYSKRSIGWTKKHLWKTRPSLPLPQNRMQYPLPVPKSSPLSLHNLLPLWTTP